MRFNIDIKVILKKWLVQLMCMVRFLCRRLDYGLQCNRKLDFSKAHNLWQSLHVSLDWQGSPSVTMERLDRTLDDIISSTKKMQKRKVKTVKKSGKGKNKAMKKKPGHDGKGNPLKLSSNSLSANLLVSKRKDATKMPNYLDVDAPSVGVVQLSYGADTLPPPSKKMFGSKKAD